MLCSGQCKWPSSGMLNGQMVTKDLAAAKLSEGSPSAVSTPSAAAETNSSETSETSTLPFLPRPLTKEERLLAWRAANFFDAEPDQERPIALWILGPSSVGKSTISADVEPHFEIPSLHTEDVSNSASRLSGDPRRRLNAVLIDGEFIRDAHGVWKSWIQTSGWALAYPALKATINQEKDLMCTEAVRSRKHVLIPQTALNLPKALSEIKDMAERGYTNHVLAVVAPLTDCQRRGQKREVETGKRYKPDENELPTLAPHTFPRKPTFDRSVEAIPPLIAACNGRYSIVQVHEIPEIEHGMKYQTLDSGNGRSQAGVNAPTDDLDLPSLREEKVEKEEEDKVEEKKAEKKEEKKGDKKEEKVEEEEKKEDADEDKEPKVYAKEEKKVEEKKAEKKAETKAEKKEEKTEEKKEEKTEEKKEEKKEEPEEEKKEEPKEEEKAEEPEEEAPLEKNFNKIAPFGKEDIAKELQDHAAKTQDTLVDAVEKAEVAEIKRAVFRALTGLRVASIKEFDTIVRLETQSIDAYKDAHHYRSENPLAHLHEDEAPVETDKLKSFH
ncbi:unnamed protein product [Polarella glacialis]|uniref:Zeta toxin domain-containing protein n=1 Tax=Polarella glacialis TaxID=89957 RepID=A0A813K9S3_POLGL|nr:unnamed protein product [Polarella glacialis]